MSKGKLIVIEGACDGIGKTTQYKKLYEKLSKEGEVVRQHFPSYETKQGALPTAYLAGEYGDKNDLSQYFVHALYAIDRAVTWKTVLEKEYNAGKTILLDRYTSSSMIYQSTPFSEDKRDEFIEFMVDYEFNKLGTGKPDMVIFLTAPFDLVTKMRNERKDNDGVKNDIYERDLDFMKRAYDNANNIAKKYGWKIIECASSGKLRTPEDISEEIYSIVKKIK